MARTTKHGMSRSPEYRIWQGMKSRCSRPDSQRYARYGGRGITVCERWRGSFENFYADMGPRPSSRHSIDRIDNDGHYDPANCRWATSLEQARNHGCWVDFRGLRLKLREVSEITGVAAIVIEKRIDRGWALERAATLPSKPTGSGKLTRDDVDAILGLSSAGVSDREIARRLSIHHASVARIRTAKTGLSAAAATKARDGS
jgi:hypothetical protein